MTTVYEAQQQFLKDLPEGTICPVCNRAAEVYPYTVTRMLARLLEATVTLFGNEWVPTKQLPLIPTPRCPTGKFVTNYNMLKHFGLLEPRPEKKAQWRVTQLGSEFVRGEVTVARRILVCLDQCLAKSSLQLSFAEATDANRRYQDIQMIPTVVKLPEIAEREVSLEIARQLHKEAVADGTYCIVCGRYNEIYKRALNSGMATILLRMAKAHKCHAGYVHVYNDLGGRCGEYGQMEFWGLIEPDKNRDGYWRITDKGLQFATGELSVPKQVVTLNDQFVGLHGPAITIQQALATRFDKMELLQAV